MENQIEKNMVIELNDKIVPSIFLNWCFNSSMTFRIPRIELTPFYKKANYNNIWKLG